MRDRVAAAGYEPLLVPGVMPLTTPRTLLKTEELSGVRAPAAVADRLLPLADDAAAFRAEGMDIVTELCERLLSEGVPALHFYTFNRAKATKEVVARLNLAPATAH